MNNKIKNFLGNQSGIAALLTIVVVAAASLIMAYSAAILGLGELEMGYTAQQGGEAFAVADGCMEETLRRLKLDGSYSGETLTLDNGLCIIGVSGNTITVTGTVGQYNKKIQADFTLSGSAISVNSWEELSL